MRYIYNKQVQLPRWSTARRPFN